MTPGTIYIIIKMLTPKALRFNLLAQAQQATCFHRPVTETYSCILAVFPNRSFIASANFFLLQCYSLTHLNIHLLEQSGLSDIYSNDSITENVPAMTSFLFHKNLTYLSKDLQVLTFTHTHLNTIDF